VTLSVVIPCFNEEQTLANCVSRVLEIQDETLSVEAILVDDCSSDRSFAIAEHLAGRYPEVRIFRHAKNRGKGAALRTGFREATGDFVAVQDADLEYDPAELRGLLGPLRSGKADVVLGSRFLGGTPHRVLYFWHYLGNLLLTFLSNMFTDLNLTDMETCYKMVRADVLKRLPLTAERFGIEVELTARLAQAGARIWELPISYSGRTYAEGKKITWRDGLAAMFHILRYNLLPPRGRWRER
jgi:glycosyltransferase involved in cell wall biosynthesis